MNRIKQFLDNVCSHIRCGAVHEDIRTELLSHINELRAEYIKQGLSEADADKKAVAAMGDSNEIGVMLDARHRPRTDWVLLLLVLAIAVFGAVGMYFYGIPERGSSFTGYIFSAAVGAAVLAGAYFFDYTKLEKTALPIYIFSVGMAFLTAARGISFNGARTFMRIGFINFNSDYTILLLCIAYAGFIMKFKNQGSVGVLITAALGIFSFVPYLIMPNSRLIMIMLVCYSVMLIAAIARGHFGGKRKLQLLTVIGLLIVLPAAVIFLFPRPYLISRIAAMMSRSKSDIAGNGYQQYMTDFWLKNSRWFGAAQADFNGMGIEQTLPSPANDFALISFFATFGRAVGIVLILLIAAFVVRLFASCFKIKNSYGFFLALGAAAALAAQFIGGIMINFGLFPAASAMIPFISYSGTGYIISMALVGLVLSVWRRDNILPKTAAASNQAWRRRLIALLDK